MTFFLRILIINGLIFFCCFSLMAQVKLVGSTYTENFNTLAKTGTSNVLPPGWLLEESGTNANGLYTASNGMANSGDTYSFGMIDEEDRSLGCLQSGSLIPAFGIGFTNTTNAAFSARSAFQMSSPPIELNNSDSSPTLGDTVAQQRTYSNQSNLFDCRIARVV